MSQRSEVRKKKGGDRILTTTYSKYAKRGQDGRVARVELDCYRE
jgi:hypothetical protein